MSETEDEDNAAALRGPKKGHRRFVSSYYDTDDDDVILVAPTNEELFYDSDVPENQYDLTSLLKYIYKRKFRDR